MYVNSNSDIYNRKTETTENVLPFQFLNYN